MYEKWKKEIDNSIIYVDATKMYKNRHDNNLLFLYLILKFKLFGRHTKIHKFLCTLFFVIEIRRVKIPYNGQWSEVSKIVYNSLIYLFKVFVLHLMTLSVIPVVHMILICRIIGD